MLVANSTKLKYVEVPDCAFQDTTGQQEVEHYELRKAEVVAFKPDVRVLSIAEIEDG